MSEGYRADHVGSFLRPAVVHILQGPPGDHAGHTSAAGPQDSVLHLHRWSTSIPSLEALG
jgi:hypothetical protein